MLPHTPFGLTHRLYKSVFCHVQQIWCFWRCSRIGWITADHTRALTPSRDTKYQPNTAKRSGWKVGLKCSVLWWVRQFKAKWIVMISDYANVINRNKLSCISFFRTWLKKKKKHQQKQDVSLQSSLPDQSQVNSTAVSEEVYSEAAINWVWHLKGGVVNLSLEYLVLVEVCIQNVLLFLFDLFQVNKKKKNSPPGENNNSFLVACCWPNSVQLSAWMWQKQLFKRLVDGV